MANQSTFRTLADRFESCFAQPPEVLASAPGRIEVLGNHTDYNEGLALSCAVAMRCRSAVSLNTSNQYLLASTAYGGQVHAYSAKNPVAADGHWTSYVLGLVSALEYRGHEVPGFSLLIDSDVPPSAGLSSSAALEIAVLIAILDLLGIELLPIELAKIGQQAESVAVGARAGLLDQLTSLLGRRNHLLGVDFQSLRTNAIAMPAGYCFVCIDSGVAHDLSNEYNIRRVACETSAQAMGIGSLRGATMAQLEASRAAISSLEYGCAKHVIDENKRVSIARQAIAASDMSRLGQLLYESHESSRRWFLNSCEELDEIVALTQSDPRCLGARLSGGGFGGITIHLVRQDQAESYRAEMLQRLGITDTERWSAVCQIDDGAMVCRNED